MKGQNCNNEEISGPKVVVVMVPQPTQGHLNQQFLQLSHHLITSTDIPVHFAGSSTHNHQARLRLHGCHDSKTSSKIQFHDFQLPPYDPSYTPSNLDLSKPIPTHLQPHFDALTQHLRELVHHLLQQLSNKYCRVIVIHDVLMAYVLQNIKLIRNPEAFTFIPIEKSKLFQLHPKYIPQCNNESGQLYNTSRVMEDRYVNLLEKLKMDMKRFAISRVHTVARDTSFEGRHESLEWLDKQEKGSVIYVSLGSTTLLTHDQVQELANGLDKCGQKFIWVLQNADSTDVVAQDNCEMKEPELPQGYEEKVRNKGIVVRDWAPHVEILAHTSVGGFMSHCGWNSCIESLSMGVPIVAWPMHSDQPWNAVLVSQVLKVGVVVRDWAHRSELVMSSSIENAVKMLMVSKEGKEMKERVVKLGEAIRGSIVEGGVSCLEMDAFNDYIIRDVNSVNRIRFWSTQNGSCHIKSRL